ncbi:MAG: efflux RND transporter periplasmic adaptor subunit [Planctomycetota bacterium]|jgi:HlyD family secretion protein
MIEDRPLPHRRPTAPRPGRCAAIVALGLLAGACSVEVGAGSGAPEEGPSFDGLQRATSTKVLTAPLARREMVRAISTTVNAESEQEIQVFPRISGVVTAVHVEEGDAVARGDALLELDARELDAALNEARIALREAEDAKRNLELSVDEARARLESAQLRYDQSARELERKEEAGEGIISRNELDQLRLTVATNSADRDAAVIARSKAEASLASQEIAIERAALQVEKAELNRSFATVEAPFDGVIADRTARVGDLASTASAAFTLTDPDNVRAVVSRPQRELVFFRRAEERARKAGLGGAELGGTGRGGDDAALDIEIAPEALPGVVYTGRIRFVSPTIDPASGQFRVTIGIDQPGAGDERPPVLPGMLLRVRIVTDRHPDALVIPKRGLLREGDQHWVFVIDGDTARRVAVEEGFAEDDAVEVIPAAGAALEAGAAIAVVGNRDLEDGDAVEAFPWAGAGGAPSAEGPDGEDA